MAKKKKNRKARRLHRKSLVNNKPINQEEKEPLTPKRTSNNKKVQEQEKGKVEQTMGDLIPRNLKVEYDKTTNKNIIIDTETGVVLDKVKPNGYNYDDEYKETYKNFHSDFFEDAKWQDYSYAEAVISSFYDYIKDIPHAIRIRVQQLVLKAKTEQGAEQVAYALSKCEDLWDICVRHKFASDDIIADFATQFLNYLPEASTQWVKDTMDEFEFHEGINDY
jgi:hypothetical protein